MSWNRNSDFGIRELSPALSEEEESDMDINSRQTINNFNNNHTGTKHPKNRSDALDSSKNKPVGNFPYPDCWNNEQRMQVLFTPFRPRDVNPESYDSRMSFWQDIIKKYCFHKNSAIFNKSELQLSFARDHQVPQCLDAVIEQMSRFRKIRMRIEYEYDPLNSWTGWALNGLMWRPLSWSSNKMKALISFGQNPEEVKCHIDYIHLEVIRQLCDEMYETILRPQQGKLLEMEEFKKIYSNTLKKSMSIDCLRICLETLHCQHYIALGYKNDEKKNKKTIYLVKVPKKGEKIVKVTETDYSILNLQATRRRLLELIENLETEIKAHEEKAKEKVKENKRQMAKVHLRKRHALEKNLEKQTIALQNIESLLESIEEANTNGLIVDAYQDGSRALKQVLDDYGLKYDNVDEVVAEVREALEMQREIDDTLGNTSILSDASFSSTENAEIEEELNEILNMQKSTNKNLVNNNNKSDGNKIAVTICDEELLQMLDKLEVEDATLNQTTSQRAT